jgi:hypothetical protein
MEKKKRTFKKWLFYKYKKMIVRLRINSKSLIKKMEVKKNIKLNEIQQPLYDICLKLISDTNSELRSNTIDYTFHIENENYLVIIRTNAIAHENYSISLIDNSSENSVPVFVDMPFPTDFVKHIILKFDREVQKRMNNRQVLKTTKVSNHLYKILKNLETNQN